jgi:hypothetical protein
MRTVSSSAETAMIWSLGLAAVLVGERQLGEDGEDLRRPTEDQGVVLLEHHGASLAQLVELLVDAVVDDADERADQKNAAQRHPQHRHPEGPAGVAAHGARVERAHEREPQRFEERRVFLPRGSDAQERDEEREERDQDDTDDAQIADQSSRSARHAVVKGIAQAVPEPSGFHGESPCGL